MLSGPPRLTLIFRGPSLIRLSLIVMLNFSLRYSTFALALSSACNMEIYHVLFRSSLYQLFGPENLRSKRFRLVSKERKTEEGDFRFWLREKWNESHKIKEGGGGGEGRKRLQTNPSILKTCVRQRTQRLIGSASRTILTCVDQRFVSYWSGRFALQRKSIFFNFVWNAKLFLRLYKGFRSFNLFSKVSPGSE